MKAKIIKIGNSKGIRLPINVIEQCGLKDEVILQVYGKKITISNEKPRKGWAKKFKSLAKSQISRDDYLKDFREYVTEWEKNEWKW